MAKVILIKKAKKERKCRKCGRLIEVGNSYYKGVINFHPDIIRCVDCGLRYWEVTTSDYQLSVGEIVYNWTKNYSADEDGIENIKSELECLLDDVQERYDNIPEQLQYAPTGELLQERIENIQCAIGELENIYIDDIKNSAFENILTDNDNATGDDNYDTFMSRTGEEFTILQGEISEEYENQLTEAIEEALSNISV